MKAINLTHIIKEKMPAWLGTKSLEPEKLQPLANQSNRLV